MAATKVVDVIISVKGLNTRGTANELRSHIHNYLVAEEGPPPIIPPHGGPVRAVQEMLFSLHNFICQVMHRSSATLHISNVERAIKIFCHTSNLLIRL